MVLRAKSLGFTTKVYSQIKQDVGVSAKKIVQMIPRNRKSCLIFGGEPTVQVKGKGKGGFPIFGKETWNQVLERQ